MDDDSIIVRFVEVPGWAITSDWMKDKFDLVLPDGEIYPDVTCTVADNDQEVIFNI